MIRAAGAAGAAGAALRQARRWLPWLVAAAILAVLTLRLPRAQLLHSLAAGPSWKVALCSAAVVGAALLADVWATLAAFAATGVRCRWRGVLPARGATYLLGLLNFAVGQGGMGLYLHRAGVAPLRVLGTLLFLFATQVGALAAVAAAGTLPPALGVGGGPLAGSLPLLAAVTAVTALAAAFAVLLVLLAWRPAWLSRHRFLAPAFAAGAGGFLRATAARLPHVVTMVAGLWLGLRLWGVALPLARGLVVLSVAVLVTVLPIAPSGLGTLELALVELTSAYAPGPTAAAQRASVLAFSFVYHVFSIAAQAAVGLLCLAWLARRARSGRARGDGSAAECVIVPLPALGQAIDRSARITR
ncbi:MAG TPA: hypothetical protein VHB47_24460 [Thermoanaerobaculia bacterium]|jgi:uncharacterized membrane protein YbhN (UPF0104 family)|nr:hypothetical protein [Thermoanaerobaculia bacterium]